MSNEGAIGESTAKRVGSHYVLDDVLGRGSMGTVWRGHDLNNGSACAIKILNPSLTTDKGATRRFIDERDILMSVDDDAVVRVTDMVVESSTFAIVMELIDGPDLARVLKTLPDHRLEQRTAVSLGIEVCQALCAIHRAGIRHLDIKPANILVEDSENVRGARITDFGVSEMVALHGPREIAGTPYYQAPEVAAGWTPTAASDLYSFGATLYEMLAGHVPFLADSAGNLLRNQPPQFISGIEPRLWKTVLTCLSPDPSQRPDSAEVLASELRSRLSGGQPVRLVRPRPRPARPVPQPRPMSQPVRPRSAPSAMSGAAAAQTPSATPVAAHQRGKGWGIALLTVLMLAGTGMFFYLKGIPGSHSDAAPQSAQARILTPEARPTRTVTAHATVTAVSYPVQIQLPGGAVECGQGSWIANPRTPCSLALEVVQSVPANHPASFAVDARDSRTGKSRHFSCSTVGQYVDCGSQDLEVYLVIPER